ncbi:hypothetical protein ES705_16312 [subsurface metagenome]
MSANSFIQQMKLKGLGRTRSTMLGDWRTVLNIEAKKDVEKYIRRDRVPSPKYMADVTWKYDKEWIYKAKTWSRIHPEAPLTEQMVTLTSDIPLTPREVEEQIGIKWPEWDSPPESLLEKVHVTSFYHKVPSVIGGE